MKMITSLFQFIKAHGGRGREVYRLKFFLFYALWLLWEVIKVLILSRTFLILKIRLRSFIKVVTVGGLKFHYFKSFRQVVVFRDLK